MMKYLIAAGVGFACLALFSVWMAAREYAAEQRGVDEQVARDIAKANQEIATRRETDAKFDSQDARALCDSMGLEWVLENGKSFCR